jgi:hypothetical protein
MVSGLATTCIISTATGELSCRRRRPRKSDIFFPLSEIRASLLFSNSAPQMAAQRKGGHGKETAPRPARPRLNPYTKALRRERIFSQLRLGASCDDIAREEGLSGQRVRKIVADALKRREVNDGSPSAARRLPAKLRLMGAPSPLAHEAFPAGFASCRPSSRRARWPTQYP